MASFKPTKPERGSIKTEGFYFTSMRFPVERAKVISRRANAHGLSFSEYIRQATEYAMIADKVEIKGVKSDEAIKISVGTTKDYSKNGAKKAAKKPAPAAAKAKAKKPAEDEEEVEEKPKKKVPAAAKAVAKTKPVKKTKKPVEDEEEVVADEEEAEEEVADSE